MLSVPTYANRKEILQTVAFLTNHSKHLQIKLPSSLYILPVIKQHCLTLAPPTVSRSHNFPTGNWNGFYKTVELVTLSAVPTPSKCPFAFEFTMEVATHNSSMLEEVGYNLGKFIEQHS